MGYCAVIKMMIRKSFNHVKMYWEKKKDYKVEVICSMFSITRESVPGRKTGRK